MNKLVRPKCLDGSDELVGANGACFEKGMLKESGLMSSSGE